MKTNVSVLNDSVNDIDFKKILQYYGIYGQFSVCRLRMAFCVKCYSVLSFPTAYYSVYGVNPYTILN